MGIAESLDRLMTKLESIGHWPKRKLSTVFNQAGLTNWWYDIHHIRTSSGMYISILPQTPGNRLGADRTISKDQMKLAIIDAVKAHAKKHPGEPVVLHFYKGNEVDGKAYNLAKAAMLEMQGIDEKFGVRVTLSDKLLDKPEPWAGPVRLVTHGLMKLAEEVATNKAIRKAGTKFGDLTA